MVNEPAGPDPGDRLVGRQPGAGNERPHRPPPRKGTGFGRVVVIAVCALVLGVVVGWVARGGPADPELVSTQQTVPLVTVTREVSP